MTTNQNLKNARKAKNDEFYTKMDDVIKGLEPYREYFKGKRVLCPCDYYNESNFYKYFKENYHALGLAGLVATCLDGIRADYNGDTERVSYVDSLPFQKTLEMENYDVSVTNPPFSIIREYYKYAKNKNCIFLGTVLHLGYDEFLQDFFDGKLHVGYSKNNMYFTTPTGNKGVGNVLFMGTVKPDRPYYKEPKPPTTTQDTFDTIDGTNIINIDSCRNIPKGYNGLMGVPLSYIIFYNPEKYKIVGIRKSPCVNGVIKFGRWVIKEV